MSKRIHIHHVRPQASIERPGVTDWQRDWLTSRGYIRDPAKTDDACDYIAKIVGASPVATAALGLREKFIIGRGLGEFGTIDLNEEQTMLDLHQRIGQDITLFSRFALRVMPARAGKKVAYIQHIPAEWVRYEFPDKESRIHGCYVIPWINSSERNLKEFQYLPLWHPGRMTPERIRADIKSVESPDGDYRKSMPYAGHIMFVNMVRPGSRVYSRPGFMSAQFDILADAYASEAMERIGANAFHLGGILVMPGDPNEVAVPGDETMHPKTRGEELQDELAESFSGAGNAGSVMVLWNQGEQGPEYKPFESGDLSKSMMTTDDMLRRRICLSVGMPEVLIGVSQPGRLGATQEIRNAIQFANEQTTNERAILEQKYSLIIEAITGRRTDITIEKISDFVDLPEWVFDRLSEEARVEYIRETFGLEVDTTTIPQPAETQKEEPDGNQR